MKNSTKIFFLIFLSAGLLISCEKQSWQKLNKGNIREVASNFQSPPVEYSMTFYWGWDGKITEEVIARDLDSFKERGVHIVSLESGYDMGSPYLSEGWFNMVKRTVELAKERNMRVWIVDEGKYPSGFAGGKFTTDAPELRMKALVIADTLKPESGDTINITLEDNIISAAAFNLNDSTNQILEIQSGKLQWTVPQGKWAVILVKHDFMSSPTRAVNNPTRGKDPFNSLCDYLDSAATRKFIEFTHEQHKKYVGEEFGKTVLGFRGDEPDYSIRGIPWTPRIFEIFEQKKGYDIKPWVASFFLPSLTDGQKKAKADYWDVWSDLFGTNFFKVQSDWCAENNLEYLVHLNHEDKMFALANSGGDFFKCMQHVQMPGIDAIWNQIWPGKISDFPKYASSAAHVFGKPRAFTESFAAYHVKPDVTQAKWVLDHQFARGINMVEVMFVPASSNGTLGLDGWTATEEFPAIAKYVHRASYLLSQGRPAASIAVYYPSMSMWMGNKSSDSTVLRLMQDLLENQHDFDFIDEYALTSLLKLKDGTLENLSGQKYSTVLVPGATSISIKALERLKEFSGSGRKVVFLGKTPGLIVEKTFLHASDKADLTWAITEPSGELTGEVLQALPAADVKFDSPAHTVKYVHRSLKNADVYFFFNEGTETLTRNVQLSGKGTAQIWDAMTGSIEVIKDVVKDKQSVKIDLQLEPYQAKFIVIGTLPNYNK